MGLPRKRKRSEMSESLECQKYSVYDSWKYSAEHSDILAGHGHWANESLALNKLDKKVVKSFLQGCFHEI